MTTTPHDRGPNVARLRARIVWLAAKNRFLRGATHARFTPSQLASMLDLPDPTSASVEYSTGLAEVIAQLPADAEPRIDEQNMLMLDNPERRHAAPDGNQVDAVAAYWLDRTGRTKRSLTERRLSLIRARLRDGWSVDQLKQAIDACLLSDWHTGSNPRGIVYTDTSHIFTVERLEQWLSHEPERDKGSDALSQAMAETVRRRTRRG